MRERHCRHIDETTNVQQSEAKERQRIKERSSKTGVLNYLSNTTKLFTELLAGHALQREGTSSGNAWSC